MAVIAKDADDVDLTTDDLKGILDRFVRVYGDPEMYVGETRAFISMARSRRTSYDVTYHTDTECRYFPEGPVHLHPASYVRGHWAYNSCPYCVAEEDDD